MPEYMSRLSKNILYNLAGQGLLLVISFFTVKYIFSGLGQDALGIIYFTAMMSALLGSMFEAGLGKTVVREIAGHFKAEPNHSGSGKGKNQIIRQAGHETSPAGISWFAQLEAGTFPP